MLNRFHLKEGMRMFRRALHVRKHGTKKYHGGAEEICTQIVKDCWNGTYFQTSAGHFSGFYMRDFGICADALLKLGYKEEVYKTLQYCLIIYSREDKLTTTITPDAKPIDVFRYSPDTLAFIIRTLRAAKARDLVEVYEPFIDEQVEHYFDTVIHGQTGLVNLKRFSSMKDHSARKSSCYDNCMTAMLSSELDNLGLHNPFKRYNYADLLKFNLWHGKYFDDDLYSDYIAGDANVFPYWCGIFNDEKMISKSIAAIQREGLDNPFPLKYTSGKLRSRSSMATNLAPNYEGNTIWLNIGLCYLDVVAKADRKLLKEYLEQYTASIEKHRNFLEVFNPDGTPYRNAFYHADEGMLWAAKYLALIK